MFAMLNDATIGNQTIAWGINMASNCNSIYHFPFKSPALKSHLIIAANAVKAFILLQSVK
jgi:hypothetical protein